MAKKRKKGEGTLRQRKDGRWEGRVVIGYDDGGNPKTKNVLAKTKKECTERLEQLKKEQGGSGSVKVRSEMRFGDWLDFWYQSYSKPALRHTTQLNYENWIYLHAIPGVGDIPLNKLSQSDLQQFFTEMKKGGRINNVERHGAGMADRSVRSCHAVCQMALDRAVKEGLIRTNPAIGCKLPPLREKEMKILTKEEIRRFLIQAKAEGMYELFLLDFKTGRLRISRQVYSVNGKLEVNEPKTKAAVRTIILPPAMVELLAEYKAQVFSEWMFPSRIKPEQPVDPGYVRKRLQVILERAGCKRVRFHDLRHTFAKISVMN